MKREQKSFWRYASTLFLTIFFTFIFVKWSSKTINSAKPEVSKSVFIEKMENQDPWVGVFTGRIRLVRDSGLVEVINPPNSSKIFKLWVVYTDRFINTQGILKQWKVGQKVLFQRVEVESNSNITSLRTAEIGIFLSAPNCGTAGSDRYYPSDLKVANPPNK